MRSESKPDHVLVYVSKFQGHGQDRVNPVSFRPDEIQAPSEVDESKECRTKLASSLVFDPKENNEGLINGDTHNEGLNEQVKRHRSPISNEPIGEYHSEILYYVLITHIIAKDYNDILV